MTLCRNKNDNNHWTYQSFSAIMTNYLGGACL